MYKKPSGVRIMAYTTIDDPSAFFNNIIYTGTGGTSTKSGVGFEPGLTYVKARSATDAPVMYDQVRGATKRIKTSSSNAEDTQSGAVTGWNADGFTTGSGGDVNASSETYVAWNWKAGTSFTNDASSTSIGATDSAGSVNNTAGFSICTYTGVGGTSTTIKHGLSTAPTVMLIKNRDQGDDWAVYHQGIGNTHRLYLNLTDAKTSAIGTFRNTSPTSSIFTVGDHASVNISGEKYVAYIFAEKQGYSLFGSYDANENVDGTFVYTGFTPAFVILKQSNLVRDWHMFDNKRSTFNAVGKYLRPNEAGSEDSGEEYLDFLSNGFKIKNTGNRFNDAGGTYTYYAWAEQPFVNSKGVPANAR